VDKTERGEVMEHGLKMETVFGSTAQAVHVAFLVMGQEAMQDAPLRKALIRVMESINLKSGTQRHWLDQLRGQKSDSINFGGLDGNEVRAQCAMITQAVKQLPAPEMWVLQAKYGQTDCEEVGVDEVALEQMRVTLDLAQKTVAMVRVRMQNARAELDSARDFYIACEKRIARPGIESSARTQYYAARDAVRDIGAELAKAESREREAQIALEKMTFGHQVADNGRLPMVVKPRYAFSAERIDAIKGLSDWLHPQFPRIKPFALDCMVGRLFSNHKKLDITFRDLAATFGGNAMQYQRASYKLRNTLRQLEQMAIERLEGRMVADGVAMPTESV
jgi:hypothetical protein